MVQTVTGNCVNVKRCNKYNFHIVTKELSSSGWNIFGLGFGNMSSYTSEIELCETKHSTDYKILSHWIDKQ